MLLEIRKLQLIEELLKVNDDQVLSELEALLSQQSSDEKSNKNLTVKFSNIWSVEEANEVNHAIMEGCENINPNDWK